MHRNLSASLRKPGHYRGSGLLASAVQRLARVSLAVAFLWMMTAWAMGWWP
ncbi:hypothetical protein [Pollutimonas nitritireducens]|uniref:hypothetical protein n=1 Tax=Pollutimonas nitritireducens TaxID=2045209 RepID=UPI0013041171|nr:hypothetical protein [Pollutimonas nitritireducens]